MNGTYKKNLTNEQKIIYLKALSYVMSNSFASKRPPQLLREQAEAVGLPVTVLNTLPQIKRPETISNELIKIQDRTLRRYIVREMIMLAVTDHEISDAEMCNLYKIGAALGIREGKINDFFLWAAQGIEWQIEGERLVEDDV